MTEIYWLIAVFFGIMFASLIPLALFDWLQARFPRGKGRK